MPAVGLSQRGPSGSLRPSGRGSRGAALAGVLAVASLLAVVTLALAVLSLHSLQVAEAQRDGAQAELLTRAVAEQFIREFRGASSEGNPIELQGGNPLLLRYRDHPVFPDGAENLGADVTVTFDPTKAYCSVDNSSSDVPARSWHDLSSSSGKTSVPPFGVSLVTTVRAGQRTLHYEAILQRRWPYALTINDTVTLMGTPIGETEDHEADYFAGASTVMGPLFVTGVPISHHRPSPAALLTEMPGLVVDPMTGGTYERPIALVPLPVNLFESLETSQRALQPEARVEIGRGKKLYGGAETIQSRGNKLLGRVDFSQASRTWWNGLAGAEWVKLHPENEWKPQLTRTNIGTPEQLAALRDQIFVLPRMNTGRPVPNLEGRPEQPDSDRTFFLMRKDVNLVGSASGNLEFGSGSRFYVPGSAGNRYCPMEKVEKGSTQDEEGEKVRQVYRFWPQVQTGKSLSLQDCLLYVDGNLDLSSDEVYDPEEPTKYPQLRGNNASLIVNGTLILNNGLLNAGDRGMVIYCQRLVMQTRGHYRGLIVVEESALMYPFGDPPSGEPTLRLEGALICGGWPFAVMEFQGNYASADPDEGGLGNPVEVETDSVPVLSASGVRLWSTRIDYVPRYLKSIHQFGDFHLVALRRLP